MNNSGGTHALSRGPWRHFWAQELGCSTRHLHWRLAFITIYFILTSQVITMVIVEFLITKSQPFINIVCGYYWQTQCQFLKKYGNSVIWSDSLFIFFYNFNEYKRLLFIKNRTTKISIQPLSSWLISPIKLNIHTEHLKEPSFFFREHHHTKIICFWLSSILFYGYEDFFS